MDEQKIFGDTLREIRFSKSISQEKLAELSGLDRSFISLLERGERTPTLSTIIKLSKGLNIKPSQLLSQFEKKYDYNNMTGGKS